MVELDINSISAIAVLFFLMASLSSTVDIDLFISKIKEFKGIGIGFACQSIFLPFFAFSLVEMLEFDTALGVALILTGASPGGVLSNFFAFAVGADLPLSIAMTTCSSILSFATLTLNGYACMYIKT